MTEKASAPRRRLNVIGRLDAQHRQWIALPLAIAAGFLLPGDTPLIRIPATAARTER